MLPGQKITGDSKRWAPGGTLLFSDCPASLGARSWPTASKKNWPLVACQIAMYHGKTIAAANSMDGPWTARFTQLKSRSHTSNMTPDRMTKSGPMGPLIKAAMQSPIHSAQGAQSLALPEGDARSFASPR